MLALIMRQNEACAKLNMIYRSWQYILGIFLIHLSFNLSGQSPLTAYQLASGGTKTIQIDNLPTLNNPLTRLDQESGNTIIASTEERYFSGISSSFLSYSYAGMSTYVILWSWAARYSI